MPTKKTAGDRKVTRSATIPTKGVTIDDVLTAASDLGAPNSATVTTSGYYAPDSNGESEYTHSITLSWEDTL